MDAKKRNLGTENTRKKLRLSKTKPSFENTSINIGIEAAAMEIVPQLKIEMENIRRSLESQIQSPKSSKDLNIHKLTLETHEFPNAPNNSRRTTFTCSPRESDFPLLEAPLGCDYSPKIGDHMDISPTSSHRKRHQLSPAKTNNLTSKKLCVNSSERILNNKVSNTIEDQLRKIQEDIFKKRKEDKEPDKLLSLIKPDGFSVMNVMKMKLLTTENKYVQKTYNKENRHHNIVTTRNSFDDDTDAPSIVSMEEDFRAHPEPLRLSDLQLKLDRSSQTSFESQLSPGTSKTYLSSRKNGAESLKSSSVSSYTFDAPPLVVPESVQNLKLSSNRSSNELSSSINKILTNRSDTVESEVLSHYHSLKSFQEKPELSSYSASSQSHSQRFNKQNQGDNIHFEYSRKEIQSVQGLIDDAQFQRKQIELMYKTQEDILLAQYKTELSEIEVRYRRDGQLTSTGIETKKIVEEKYETPLSKLRERRDQALSNSDARIEYLTKQIHWLKKLKKNKAIKPRSAEASPKKLTPLRSISLTSVVENSSSSESSVGLQSFEDKKRLETDREKGPVSSRRKIEKEMLWRLQEELARVQELQKVDRSLKSSRSRRDKSTSPLECVPQTSTKDAACSVIEDEENVSLQATSSLRTVEEARSTDVYNSESFESPESSETPRQQKTIAKIPLSSKPLVTARPNNKSKVLIKVPLSPRVQVRSRRRGSSGSDESLLLSQNETQSEQSDYEVRILALKEQKRQRFAELNRLERELKRAQREQLKATESALVKQIQAYELKIEQTKKQLEEVTSTTIVRPQIKHPRVSDKFFPRTSDAFQKMQVPEVLPKQQEHNVSDLDTNSLKSVSEASSTETTIQSSGQVPSTELTSKPSVEGEEDHKDVVSVGSEVSEALSSVATEGPTVLDTQKSVESEIPDLSELTLKSGIPESANLSSDAVNWMDAEEFFKQMESKDNFSTNESELSKISAEKSVSSGSPETNISEELTNESQGKSKSNSSSQEFEDAEEVIAFQTTELSENSSTTLESDSIKNPVEEEASLQVVSPEKDNSYNQLDEGRIVSIVSESPSNKSQNSVSEVQSSINTELQSSSNKSLPSPKPDSDVSQCEDEGNVSIAISEKSNVSEVLSQSAEVSVATDSNVTSHSHSGDDGNNSSAQSDVDENCNSSQSEVIKVFVSNKNQESKEQTGSNNHNLINKTFQVSEEKTEPQEDGSVVDQVTDKILQNLLHECLVCKKDDKAKGFSGNTTEFNELNDLIPPAINETKSQLSVNDFTQTVLNKFLKDATDCMLKIRDTKKTALIKNVSIKENDLFNNISSNKLLEALALERKSISSEKGHEENTLSSKSTKTSNNEVELSEGNESEVFWFDEDLPPVSLQTQREAEELRLKQLQIEQEIEQIKQLEAQESIPYYYLREIPNKPPPPYTPPGQSVHAKDLQPVPTKREDLEALVTSALQGLIAVWQRGDDLSAAEPTEEYCSAKFGNQVYNKFLFDLVKQILIDVTSNRRDEKDLPPWERTGVRMKRLIMPKPTIESVSNFVMKKVRLLFGFEPDSIKENLIMRWSRKKRDRVDELLMREYQEEDQDWIDYSECEVAVKNNVALSILDNLVEETGQALNRAFQKKLAYCLQSS